MQRRGVVGAAAALDDAAHVEVAEDVRVVHRAEASLPIEVRPGRRCAARRVGRKVVHEESAEGCEKPQCAEAQRVSQTTRTATDSNVGLRLGISVAVDKARDTVVAIARRGRFSIQEQHAESGDQVTRGGGRRRDFQETVGDDGDRGHG